MWAMAGVLPARGERTLEDAARLEGARRILVSLIGGVGPQRIERNASQCVADQVWVDFVGHEVALQGESFLDGVYGSRLFVPQSASDGRSSAAHPVSREFRVPLVPVGEDVELGQQNAVSGPPVCFGEHKRGELLHDVLGVSCGRLFQVFEGFVRELFEGREDEVVS